MIFIIVYLYKSRIHISNKKYTNEARNNNFEASRGISNEIPQTG